MVRINMNKEVTDGMLVGIHLWEVRACKDARSQSGELKLQIELQAVGTETKLTDHIMLEGKGWGIGKAHLIALGIDPTADADIDPLDFIGKRVWIATHVEEKEALATRGANAGKMMVFKNLRVDLKQLDSLGYQHESKVPNGNVPGMGSGDDETPF